MSNRVELARRLMEMQRALADVMDACEMQGHVCKAAGESGLAMAVYMVREAVAVYSTELSKFVVNYLKDEGFADGIEEE